MKNMKISWSGDSATGCYVNRKNQVEGILGYISIEQNKDNYQIKVSGEDGSPWRVMRLASDNSRGIVNFVTELLLEEVVKTTA